MQGGAGPRSARRCFLPPRRLHGTYTFALPKLAPGAIRDLSDPDAAEGDYEI
jgi:hypothetical protein